MRLQRASAPAPIGIVHLGPGAFFRAHTMTYIAEAVAKSGGDWGVCAVSLTSRRTLDQLEPQGCAYTAVELGPDGRSHQIIETMSDILALRDDRASVMARLVDPATRIVSLTITEKGYGDPDPANKDTAPAIIAEALHERWSAGSRPFTVLSCDNLTGNGAIIRDLVLKRCETYEPAFADWVAREGRFPSTMVDRITPATTEADIDALQNQTGYRDEACVVHEPFRQWVIEDDFVDGQRPDFEAAGALLVEDVEPFEMLKLRCLNAAHSALAYMGSAMGLETIAQCMDNKQLVAFIRSLWRIDILPTLRPTPGIDPAAYCDQLAERFSNPAIHHKLSQIAMDGSLKVKQRILPTMRDNLRQGCPSANLTLVMAAWMAFVRHKCSNDGASALHDPRAGELCEAVEQAKDGGACVDSLLALDDLIPEALRNDEDTIALLRATLSDVQDNGIQAILSRHLAETS
jgi:fructuronate reductase